MKKKPIEFSPHAEYSMRRRGATKKEVGQTIKTAPWMSTKKERFECEKEFPYNKEWNRKFYKHKKVRPVFIEEEKTIVVITVYTFYY